MNACWFSACRQKTNTGLTEQVDLEEVQRAFKTLGAAQPGSALSATRFQEAMTTLGEVMDVEELSEALRLLTGKSSVKDALPSKLTPAAFVELLGFESAAG